MDADLILHCMESENLLEKVMLSDLEAEALTTTTTTTTEIKEEAPFPPPPSSLGESSNEIGFLTGLFNDAFHFEVNEDALELQYDLVSLVEDSSGNLCPICHNEAGRHNHYGGRGCSSCRAFFRRSVQNKAYEKFACKNENGECAINSKSWKSCKFCRFQKCLASGMKPSFVLNDEERRIRHQKRTGRIQQQQQPQQQPVADIARPLTDVFTEDEYRLYMDHQSRWKSYIRQEMVTFYATNPGVFKSLVSGIYFQTIVPYEAMKLIDQALLRFTTNFFMSSSNMKGISLSDQKRLVGNNVILMINVAQSVILGNSHQSEGFLELIRGVFNECDHRFYTLKQVFNELNLTPTPPQKSLQYEQVYSSPWAPHISLEERHAEITRKICKWPTDPATEGSNQVKIDSLMLFCLGHVLLFSTDFVESLEERPRIDHVQLMYMRMLHRYLKFKYNKEANNRLTKGIMIASLARESNEIRSKRLPF